MIQQEKNDKKVFLSKAYLTRLDKNTYGLFRNIEIEQQVNNKVVREKVGKPVGPISLLKKKENNDTKPVVLRTICPLSNVEIKLVEV